MADVSVTAANVLASSRAIKQVYTAGATITAGQTVYMDATTNTVKLANADSTTATAQCLGVALHAALAGQPVVVCLSDPIFTPGFTLSLASATGGIYLLSGNNAGGICAKADFATGWTPVPLILALSTTTGILISGSVVNGAAAFTS